MDWSGPVPVHEDGSVVVDDLPPMLSDAQCQVLSDQLPTNDNESLTEDRMITSYTIAKVFVHQSCAF